jgi:cysteine sulfinate desulfinase/cysteine desulfurase-like protein
VSFISSKKFKGFDILRNTKILQASTGACCHSGMNMPSKILLAMGLNETHALNAIRISIGRETTNKDVDIIVDDLKQALESLC